MRMSVVLHVTNWTLLAQNLKDVSMIISNSGNKSDNSQIVTLLIVADDGTVLFHAVKFYFIFIYFFPQDFLITMINI